VLGSTEARVFKKQVCLISEASEDSGETMMIYTYLNSNETITYNCSPVPVVAALMIASGITFILVAQTKVWSYIGGTN
jgi:hypothetical protein